MYDWNDLPFFLELSRRGRLISAARKLHVDHTTVSRRIAALEKNLNARLFDKSPRGYQLTDAGLRLLPFAEQMEAQSNQLYQEISGKDARLSGTVRLSAPEGLSAHIIAHHLGAFREQHPDIELELMAQSRRTSLSKREADIAITLARPDAGRVIAWKLCDYRLKLYATQDYLDHHPPITGTEDLSAHDFISYIDDLIQLPELRFLDLVIKDPHVVFRSTSVLAQYNAALDGIGLSVIHCFMANQEPRLIPILPEEISINREYWLVVHEDLRQVARVDAVCRFLTRLLKDQRQNMMES
ncbi:LysR family transcriptional regulator [Paremcibacter congregatus]|uniref:LysR family transcriptional regulator n=1 Tax=Paremcibacter congregatus TaxID=2043170 RepID=A0A2G4YPT5_9PROT|nr:LysR family transcriptional regulator [Paremcibacter congregatus]PHZ84344.1 LysR family transcriptional regulator [Paremcibacter congregatus]QDE28564.1 LysR family transcriptional regulator [Paremcibacter congregatus]